MLVNRQKNQKGKSDFKDKDQFYFRKRSKKIKTIRPQTNPSEQKTIRWKKIKKYHSDSKKIIRIKKRSKNNFTKKDHLKSN